MRRTRLAKRRWAAINMVVACVSLSAVACGDSPFEPQYANEIVSAELYAMNGTPPTFPSALKLRSAAAVRIDANWSFDIAFDMDEQGLVTVHSIKAVAGELVSVHQVGLRIDSVRTFDQVTHAPTSGFVYDTSMTLFGGRTLLVDVAEPSCESESTASSLGTNIRAKLIVDSVDVASRGMFVRFVANANCGFTSLSEGLPDR